MFLFAWYTLYEYTLHDKTVQFFILPFTFFFTSQSVGLTVMSPPTNSWFVILNKRNHFDINPFCGVKLLIHSISHALIFKTFTQNFQNYFRRLTLFSILNVLGELFHHFFVLLMHWYLKSVDKNLSSVFKKSMVFTKISITFLKGLVSLRR